MAVTSNLIKIPLIYFLLIIINLSCSIDKSDNEITQFNEDKSFLQIPGVGWQTFCCTADDDNSLKYLRFKSGTAYYRFYWSKLEPQEGQYAFDMIDDLLKRCHENNQALALRIMCEDPTGQEGLPQWLIDKGIKLNYTDCEGAHYVPDIGDDIFSYYHTKLIKAFGERYDDHPDLAAVDIGSVGLWGEWHIYCDPALMPDREIRTKITDLYFESFPNTPLIALANDETNVDYAMLIGSCGWRGDSWGDVDDSQDDWAHHPDLYWPTNNRHPLAWKSGAIALEPGVPGNTMSGWTTPIADIVDDAIAWHVTYAQNKSAPVPLAYIHEIERLVMKLGFRLFLENIYFERSAKSGSDLSITMRWMNLGIAPPYRDHRIALRLKSSEEENKAVVITDSSIKGWLPGEIPLTLNYGIPDDLVPGLYELEIGIVFHSSIKHTIPIANFQKTSDGWYRMGKIQITD